MCDVWRGAVCAGCASTASVTSTGLGNLNLDARGASEICEMEMEMFVFVGRRQSRQRESAMVVVVRCVVSWGRGSGPSQGAQSRSGSGSRSGLIRGHTPCPLRAVCCSTARTPALRTSCRSRTCWCSAVCRAKRARAKSQVLTSGANNVTTRGGGPRSADLPQQVAPWDVTRRGGPEPLPAELALPCACAGAGIQTPHQAASSIKSGPLTLATVALTL